MGKKIRWTAQSIKDRKDIYKYWFEHNQSDLYSKKLDLLFEKSAELILNLPNIGVRTSYGDIHVKIVKYYKIFYRIRKKEIQIIRV